MSNRHGLGAPRPVRKPPRLPVKSVKGFNTGRWKRCVRLEQGGLAGGLPLVRKMGKQPEACMEKFATHFA